MAREIPLGGNLNDAVRVGDTVRRRAGPWTPTVHELLGFLEAEGFPAPRPRGMDDRGREILEYIEGDAYPDIRCRTESFSPRQSLLGEILVGTTTWSLAFGAANARGFSSTRSRMR